MNEDNLNDPEYLRDCLAKALEYIEILKRMREANKQDIEYYESYYHSLSNTKLKLHENN
mgnify:CR=1 FL=1